MNTGVIGILVIIIVLILLGSGIWVFMALILAGLVCFAVFTHYGDPAAMATLISWGAINNFSLAPLPLFILMGDLLLHTGFSERLYGGLAPWLQALPGRLLHSNILACSVVAAMTASSAACCATVGSVAIPELEKRGYDQKLSVGSIAGGGTLGLLIPPSGGMIIYAMLTGESLGKCFMAGIIPGLVLVLLFMMYIVVAALRDRNVTPPAERYDWKARVVSAGRMLPSAVIILLVLGGMYLGWFTPTEAAAVGVASVIIVGLAFKSLTWHGFRDSLLSSVRISCMIVLIVIGASILSTTVAYLGIPQMIAESLEALSVSRYVILAAVCIMYLGLGCLLDGISMMVLTLPIIYPAMMRLGFDSIWFAVIITLLIEAAQITPPVGFNLYVLQGITKRPLTYIAGASVPFLILLCIGIVIVTVFPQLATWLPSTMR
jgi:tripartite ATP-independent transporter DctM subunit